MKNLLKIFVSGLFVFGSLFFASNALAATVTATATPSTIIKGESSVITWASSSLTTCSYITTVVPTGNGGNSPTPTTGLLLYLGINKVFADDTSLSGPSLGNGSPGFSGSGVVSPDKTTIYNITCTNGASTQVTVTVNTSSLDLISAITMNSLTGNSQSFTSTVTNIGPGTTGRFSNKVTLSDTKTIQDYSFNSNALSSGQSSTSTFSAALSPLMGLGGPYYTLRLCADGGSVIRESNEGNNCSERCFDYSEQNHQIYSYPCIVGNGDGEQSGITVTLSANPTSMTLPTNSTTLTWGTTGSPESCVATGGWSWTKTTALTGGTQVVSNLTAGTHTFDITCSKAGEDDVMARVEVEVSPASADDITVSISANPSSMTLPANVTRLTWVTTGNPTSCEANSISWSGDKDANGGFEDRTGMTAGTYIFGITCHKAGLTDANSTTTVVVHPEGYPATTGDLTATNCTIGENESSCDTKLTWDTFDAKPGKVSAVTTPEKITVATGNSGTKSYTLSFPSIPGSRNFYLYNDENKLKEVSATADCSKFPIATIWNGTFCTSGAIPTGTLTGDNCVIAKTKSTCLTTLTLNVINPIAGKETNVTKKVPADNTIVVPSAVIPTFPVDKPNIVVAHGGTTFFLNHNSLPLDILPVGASCESGTSWDSLTNKCKEGVVDGYWTSNCGACDQTSCKQQCTRTCVPPVNNGAPCSNLPTSWEQSCNVGSCVGGDGTLSLTLTATPSKIFKGSSSKLTWSSEDMVEGSCVGSTNKPDESFTIVGGVTNNATGLSVYPKTTTIYTITCTKVGGGTATDTAPITVNGIKIWET